MVYYTYPTSNKIYIIIAKLIQAIGKKRATKLVNTKADTDIKEKKVLHRERL